MGTRVGLDGWELGSDWTGAENLEGAEDFFPLSILMKIQTNVMKLLTCNENIYNFQQFDRVHTYRLIRQIRNRFLGALAKLQKATIN